MDGWGGRLRDEGRCWVWETAGLSGEEGLCRRLMAELWCLQRAPPVPGNDVRDLVAKMGWKGTQGKPSCSLTNHVYFCSLVCCFILAAVGCWWGMGAAIKSRKRAKKMPPVPEGFEAHLSFSRDTLVWHTMMLPLQGRYNHAQGKRAATRGHSSAC